MKPLPIAILISGSGTNLQAIIDRIETQQLNAVIKAVISNNATAYGLKRAHQKNIFTEIFSYKEFKENQQGTREEYDTELARRVKKYEVELVVLAGWMHVLSPQFLQAFPQRVINLHPALLPSFPGTHAIEQAWNYGVRYTGVTVHCVDAGVDTGPIILQEIVEIKPDDTLERLEERIHQTEYRLLPAAIQLYAENRITITGRKVHIAV